MPTSKSSYPKIQEHYKNKEVVFVNICINSGKDEWHAALSKYKPGGINLFAEGLESHPVPKSYSIYAVPHHVLIDKEGRMVSNNEGEKIDTYALQPGRGENAIDKLLK